MYKDIMEIYESLKYIENEDNNIQPTFLYNEGWMLKLVLKWFHMNKNLFHELAIKEQSKWYSEALLSSKFLPVFHGDKLAESYTHADGVYGDFRIGGNGFGDLILMENCREFVVVEAKMFSKYSRGIKNALNYNQAARNVACMCNIVVNSGQNPENISFYTVIPKIQMTEELTFSEYINIEHIKQTVLNRVNQYINRDDHHEKNQWYYDSFLPFCGKIKIGLLSWEDIIEFITLKNSEYGNNLNSFYQLCIKYNRKFKQ